jgi:hypothetical protein
LAKIKVDGVSLYNKQTRQTHDMGILHAPIDRILYKDEHESSKYLEDYMSPYFVNGHFDVHWDFSSFFFRQIRDTITGHVNPDTYKDTFTGFTTSIVTNYMRANIYELINLVNSLLDNRAILVISGGEAINASLPKELRSFTGDIDTKVFPCNDVYHRDEYKNSPCLNTDYQALLDINERMWYTAVDSAVDLLNTQYEPLYHTVFRGLELRTDFQIIGVKFLVPDNVTNPFSKRLSTMPKTDTPGASRQFDVQLFAIDLDIANVYAPDWSLEYVTGDKVPFFVEPSKLSVEDQQTLYKRIPAKYRQDKSLTPIETIDLYYAQMRHTVTSKTVINKNLVRVPDKISGVLDMAIQKPGYLGYSGIDQTTVRKLTTTDGRTMHAYYLDVDYLIHDIEAMLAGGLREHKRAKDERRIKLLKDHSLVSGVVRAYTPQNPINYVSNGLHCTFQREQVSLGDFVARSVQFVKPRSATSIYVFSVPPRTSTQPFGLIGDDSIPGVIIKKFFTANSITTPVDSTDYTDPNCNQFRQRIDPLSLRTRPSDRNVLGNFLLEWLHNLDRSRYLELILLLHVAPSIPLPDGRFKLLSTDFDELRRNVMAQDTSVQAKLVSTITRNALIQLSHLSQQHHLGKGIVQILASIVLDIEGGLDVNRYSWHPATMEPESTSVVQGTPQVMHEEGKALPDITIDWDEDPTSRKRPREDWEDWDNENWDEDDSDAKRSKFE